MTLNRRLARIDRRMQAVPLQAGPAAPLRLSHAADVLSLLEEAVNEVRSDAAADPLDRARTLGYLAGVALKALEVRDLATRVEALEAVLRGRRAN